MIYLDEARVRELLAWPELIDAMRSALASFSAGEVQQPVRSILTVEEGKRYFGIMPAISGEVMGLKAVSFYPANEGSPYPTHDATILLFATSTGEPIVAVDGRLITEMRTAAVSAAVTRAIHPENRRILALLGSGVQAHAHLEALRHVCAFDDVRVWSRTAEHAERFARRHSVRAMNAQDAVRDADVIVVATSSQTPVLQGEWIKPGAHVNAVGANRPTWRELDDDAMSHALIVDSREGARTESGDVILSKAMIYAEAGEIFAGTAAAPPEGTTTIFKSLGMAVEDIAAARLIAQRASLCQ